MAKIASPYGLRPISLIGSQDYNGGGIREIPLTVNNANAIFNGDMIVLTDGVPTPYTAATTGPTTTASGLIGVCVGVRYQLANGNSLGYPLYAQYLPANAVTAGYVNIFIRVSEDPDQLFLIQSDGTTFPGYTNPLSFTNGVPNLPIGANVEMVVSSTADSGRGSTFSGNANWALAASTASFTNSTYALRIVDFLNSNQQVPGSSNFESISDPYPEVIVKLNFGVHSYYNSTAH
ncbi:MAG TPA: hypothetical protein PLQ34_07880 [Ferrovaceae bacterium]|jgi:hypothetical protein|nr:hypothetical protein [Ferrovaceae bacterium]